MPSHVMAMRWRRRVRRNVTGLRADTSSTAPRGTAGCRGRRSRSSSPDGADHEPREREEHRQEGDDGDQLPEGEARQAFLRQKRRHLTVDVGQLEHLEEPPALLDRRPGDQPHAPDVPAPERERRERRSSPRRPGFRRPARCRDRGRPPSCPARTGDAFQVDRHEPVIEDDLELVGDRLPLRLEGGGDLQVGRCVPQAPLLRRAQEPEEAAAGRLRP